MHRDGAVRELNCKDGGAVRLVAGMDDVSGKDRIRKNVRAAP